MVNDLTGGCWGTQWQLGTHHLLILTVMGWRERTAYWPLTRSGAETEAERMGPFHGQPEREPKVALYISGSVISQSAIRSQFDPKDSWPMRHLRSPDSQPRGK